METQRESERDGERERNQETSTAFHLAMSGGVANEPAMGYKP